MVRAALNAPQTPAEYRAWWEENADVPYGFCWCGCGNTTSLAKSPNRPKQLIFNGEPIRYLPGHASAARHEERRAKLGEPNPSGLCMCGCGRKTPIAKQSHTQMGWVKDKPIQYISGHGPRKLSPEQEAELCRRYSEGEKPKVLANAFGVSVSGLMKILDRNGVDRRYWKAIKGEREAEICRRYEAGDKVSEIAADAGVNLTSIYGVLKRNGILATRNDGMPEAQQMKVCRQYLNGSTPNVLAREFGVSETAIGNIIKKNGIEKRSASEVHRRYTCDHSFFDEIDSEAKAYWLGFIAADGCVMDSNVLQITLSGKDHEHLLRFKESIRASHPVSRGTSSANLPVSRIAIASPQLASALAAHGIVPRKTFILEWPKHLSPELVRHFLRGYSDGDGWFHVTKSGYVRKRDGERRDVLHWGIAGTEVFCRDAQKFVMKAAGVTEGELSPHPNSPKIFRLAYGSTIQASKIYELLYEEATVCLARKRKVAEPYVRSVAAFTDGLVPVNRRGLRSLREERGLTLNSLAARSGAHWSTILELETGARLTDPALVERLATALKVPYRELCADPSEPNPPAEKNPSPLSAEQVREIRQRFADGAADHRGLASEYGVGKSTIGRVLRKEGRWASLD